MAFEAETCWQFARKMITTYDSQKMIGDREREREERE